MRDCLVAILVHDGILTDQNGCWDNEIAIEEFLWRERAIGGFVSQSEEKENSRARIKGSRNKCNDRAGIFGESVGDLEGRNKDEGASETEKDVASDVAVKLRNLEGSGHQDASKSEADGADSCCKTRAISIEQSTHWKC